jgi:heavy metal sensor kinase
VLESIRVRLALWHTGVLAVVLLAFIGAIALFLSRSTRARERQDLVETVAVFRHAFEAEWGGGRSAAEAAQHAAQEFRFSGRSVQVYGLDGSLITVSDSAARTEAEPDDEQPDPEQVRALATSASGRQGVFATLRAGEDERVPAYAEAAWVAGERFTLVALQMDDAEEEVLDDFLGAALVAVPLALLLAGLGGYLLARRSLAPVVAMSERAARIGARSLHERLPVPHPKDELGRLARVFNELLARLERAFAQQRQFMADASHELRTPVAILRAETDVALALPRSPGEYRESLETMRTATARLAALVENLFALTRADAGHLALRTSSLYLEELIADTVRSLRALAQARGVVLEYVPETEGPFRGDDGLLRQLLLNLLDNAIKYTPSGGRVGVTLEPPDHVYRIRVRDTGAGIPPEVAPHIFDRFYRGENSRGRVEGSATGGAGLGLAIARWIAEAHGGSLELTATGPSGSTFTLELPACGVAPALQPA